MLRSRLRRLLPTTSTAISPMISPIISPMISPEHRSPAWILTFAITVGMALVFVYQAAYSWEFVATAHGNILPPAKRWTPAVTTTGGSEEASQVSSVTP